MRRDEADVRSGSRSPGGRGHGRGRLLAALVVGLVLGASAMALATQLTGDEDGFGGRIDDQRAQAVILSNDKVYFGKLSEVTEEFYALDNAFFLREVQASAEADPQRSLLPVTEELHSPEGRMLIRKAEVVLVENLEAGSPIQQEITRRTGG